MTKIANTTQNYIHRQDIKHEAQDINIYSYNGKIQYAICNMRCVLAMD